MHSLCLKCLILFGKSKSTSFQVSVMSVGLLLCCLLWLFNSILPFLACVVKMFFILSVEYAGSLLLESPAILSLQVHFFIDLWAIQL